MFLAANPPSFNFKKEPSGLNSCSYGSMRLPDLLIFAQNRSPRPCLIDAATSPAQRQAKRVVFADDKGFPLTQVRVMKEPSACPPRWTRDYIERVTGSASPRPEGTESSESPSWEPVFQQPISDYMDFRTRLDTLNVSVENLIVQDKEQVVTGTVKVKNLSYAKQIKARVTFDHWKTHQDVLATHVPSGAACSSLCGTNLYDTFSFAVKIPEDDATIKRVELCVCYSCDAGEFWDNNFGKNYTFVKPQPKVQKPKVTRDSIVKTYACYGDALNAMCENWTEFASWNHLSGDGPYW